MRGTQVPVVSGSLLAWAQNIINYLRTLEKEVEQPSPKSVQLEHRKITAKAIQDGVLMWCPVTETVIVSKGGEWFPVELGAALPIVGIE